MDTNNAYKYEELYGKMKDLGNPILLQSFAFNNNTDIIKGIEYWEKKRNGASDDQLIEIDGNIVRFENMMLQRLRITEDLFATEIPMMKHGPSQQVKVKPLDLKKDKKETKVVEHPASKNKKKEQTVNDKVGDQIKKETEPKVVQKKKTEYDKLYPTEEKKLDAINAMLPSVEKDLTNGLEGLEGDKLKAKTLDNESKALRRLKHHLKSWGEYVPFCTVDQIKSLIHWIKEDKFQHLSPFSVLHDKSLSITDILKEAEKLVKVDGLGEQEVKDYLSYYVIDNRLAEQSPKDIIRTKEEYDNFFQRSINFLFDEYQRENKAEKKVKSYPEKDKTETPNVSRNDTLENLFEIHKDQSNKCINKIARDLQEWEIKEGNKKYTFDLALAAAALFVKAKDPAIYEEYDKRRSKKKDTSGGNKKQTPKTEVKEESKKTDKVDGKEGETDTPTGKTIFNRLEDILKHKDKKEELSEYLISIVNKHIKPIGERKDGLSKQIEDLTTLAKKRFLELGMKDCDDWTEKDVLQWMGEEVVPYVTDEYGILKSRDDDELKSNLEFYMEKYPVGDQKKRSDVLKEVLTSEIPRTKFMKSIARKVRKGNFAEINELFKQIADSLIEKQKKEVKKEKTK